MKYIFMHIFMKIYLQVEYILSGIFFHFNSAHFKPKLRKISRTELEFFTVEKNQPVLYSNCSV